MGGSRVSGAAEDRVNEDFRSAIDGATLERDVSVECDVAIVGTGAGGGTAAELLSRGGLRVVMLEEGPLMTARDFHMIEREAYPNLYQESAGAAHQRQRYHDFARALRRRIDDGQLDEQFPHAGRYARVLARPLRAARLHHRCDRAVVRDDGAAFERSSLAVPPNENNAVLARGADALGIPTAVIPRNVKGCRNLGYCGMGCPVDAKQSMLVTTIPAAIRHGAQLYSRVRVRSVTTANGRCTGRSPARSGPTAFTRTGATITVRAKTVIAAGGAINTPALFLRSALPDPHATLGKRTFLHPGRYFGCSYAGRRLRDSPEHRNRSTAITFYERSRSMGRSDIKLEVPPLHPILMATTSQGMGIEHAQLMRAFPNTQIIIALLRDGFHPSSAGGVVSLNADGSPLLDYPMNDYLWDGARRALRSMAAIQFAAGATSVMPVHESARAGYVARSGKRSARHAPNGDTENARGQRARHGRMRHGDDPSASVVASDGRYHHLENLYVFDGSAFPTSLGANPQLSIYGMVARNATKLAQRLTGRDVGIGA